MAFKVLNSSYRDQDMAMRNVADRVNALGRGHTNAIKEDIFTLTASATTTVLSHPNIHPGCFISFMPLSAKARHQQARWWFDTPGIGSVTVNHDSDAATDQNFRVIIFS